SATARMRRMLGAAVGCIMAAGSAAAEIAPDQLAGRWTASAFLANQACGGGGCNLTYDMGSCGAGRGGLEVQCGQSCSRAALHLNAGRPSQSAVEFMGRYERAKGSQPYSVRAILHFRHSAQAPEGQPMLSVLGSTDGDFQPLRRRYPLHMYLSRAGDAVCRG